MSETSVPKFPLPDNEAARVEELARYDIVDSLPEQTFDDLALLAAQICQTPIALITFIEGNRQWFKSKVGTPLAESTRADSFCQQTLLTNEFLLVPDAREDKRFADLLFVAGEPHLRFYAGVPLVTGEGLALGTLCVLDVEPRQLSLEQSGALQALARQVMSQMELRRALVERERVEKTLREHDERLRLITDALPVLIAYLDTEERYVFNNQTYQEWFGRSPDDLKGQPIREALGEADYEKVRPHIEAAMKGERVSYEATITYRRAGTLHTHTSLVPDFDESGRVRGVVALVNDITARKNAEIALEENRQRYRSLFEYNPDAVYSFDLNGNYLSVNPACSVLSGYSEAEMLAMNFAPLIVPEDLERTLKYFGLAAQGQTQNYEIAITHKEGRRVEVNVTNLPIVVDGHIIGVYGVAKNISKRKRAEAQLQKANERIVNILESITDAVCSFDRQWRYSFVNERAAQLIGRSREELLGQSIWEVFPYLPETNLWHEFHRVMNERVQVVFEYHSPIVQGWLEMHAYPAAEGISVYFHSIAERKAIEAAQINQQQWLQEVLNLAPVPMIFVEPGTARVTFANRAADELAGGEFPRAQIADEYRDAYFCSDAEGRRIADDAMPGVRVARGERLEEFQMDWHTPKGKLSLLIYADTLPAMHGHEATGIVVFQNVSAIKQVEAQLRDANRLKDEFLATVSHELRTPLTAIIGWAHLLRAGALDAENTRRALDTIERNGRAQSQLIEDLLDVSRIISGKLRLEVRRVELALAIESAVESVRPAAEAKGVGLQTILDPEAGPVQGDPDRLGQIIWNLLANAVKFTPAGGRVQICLQRVHSHIEIVVSDTGQGIEAAFLPHVFDRFRQADQAATREYGGLGLGLAITRHLVELHGGTIHATSAGVGQGATFTVRLPTMMANSDAERIERREQPTAPATPPPQEHFDLRGLRILVADDEADTADLVALVLEQRGALVTTVTSALQALAFFDESPPDVLVSDIGMPEQDGYFLIGRVRERAPERGGRVPAVALTAYARVEDRVRALASGFQVHVPKPVEPVEIVAVVASLAGRAGSTEHPAANT